MIDAYPSSGELNFHVEDMPAAIARVSQVYADKALSVDHTDGISMTFKNWRFNLRSSNTERVLRLNVESEHDVQLMEQKVQEISSILTQPE